MLIVWSTTIASSMDGFACGFLMGLKRIRLTPMNVIVISLFPVVISFLSMSLCTMLLPLLQEQTAFNLSALLYFVLAIDAFLLTNKTAINEEWIDPNADRKVTGMEVIRVGFMLSMDTMVVALPLAFLGYSPLWCSLLFGLCSAMMLVLGNQLVKWVPPKWCRHLEQLSWIVFLCLGIHRLIRPR